MMLFLQPHDITRSPGLFHRLCARRWSHTWNVVLILIELMVISTFLDDYGFFEFCAVKAMHIGRRRYEKAIHLYLCGHLHDHGRNVQRYRHTDAHADHTEVLPARRASTRSRSCTRSSSPPTSPRCSSTSVTSPIFSSAMRSSSAILTLRLTCSCPPWPPSSPTYLIFYYIFRDSLKAPYPVDTVEVNAGALIKNKAMVAVGLIVLAFVLIGCGFANWLLLPLSVVTTIGRRGDLHSGA